MLNAVMRNETSQDATHNIILFCAPIVNRNRLEISKKSFKEVQLSATEIQICRFVLSIHSLHHIVSLLTLILAHFLAGGFDSFARRLDFVKGLHK